MEMSCDENVLNKLGDNEKFGYSNSLLSLSTNRNTLLTANPLAFGESQVKLRIKNILSFKKPAFYIIIISIITVLSVIVVFTTNPSKQKIITEVETKKITSAINEYYLKIDPDSKEILKIYNIKRYGDNYLVLTNKYRGEGESFSILFLVDHNFNITAKASGDIPISPCFSANVIKDKNKSIIYGNFKNKKWEPKTDTLINVQIDSIKIIFENGKKIKEKVSMDKGYIIVADTLSNIKNIEVYNNKGELQSDLNESALSEYSFINDQNDNKSQMENKENSNTSFDKSKFEEYYLETVVIRDCETKEGPGEDYKTNGTLKYGDIILAAGKYQNWLLANNGQKNFWVESSNIIDEKKHIEYNLGIITAEKVMVGTVPLYKGNLVQILKRDKDMTCVTIRVIDINVGKTGWIKNSDYVPAKEGVYFNQAYLKKGTIIYKEPSLKSGQIDDYEPKQYEIFVNIEKEQNGWVLISTFGPLNGWVRKENIFIPTAEALTDDEKRAFQVVNEYFDAFSKSNYNKMCALATEKHNNTFVHSDNVWGIKWAKARQIDLIKDPSFLGIGSSESVLVFNISAYIATEKNSAQYPSKITNFYVILIKDNNGNWRVDSYTTG